MAIHSDKVMGRPISLLVPPNQPDELPKIVEELQRGESIARYETVRMRKDGQHIEASLTISPIRNATGRIIGASTFESRRKGHHRPGRTERGNDTRAGCGPGPALSALCRLAAHAQRTGGSTQDTSECNRSAEP